MKIKAASFQISAPDLRSCPHSVLPEFAFIGRSNVGKSSLINLLTDKRDLAKVSATPGKTRLLNFFLINEAWHLVDLPGYGYAKVAKTESADFGEAVATYIEKRDALRRTFVLIDSMLPPQKIDIQFLRWLNDLGLTYTLLFTKADRQSPTATRKAIAAFNEVLTELNIAIPAAIACSAKSKEGRLEILRVIGEDIGLNAPRRKKVVATEEAAPAKPEVETTDDGRPAFKASAKHSHDEAKSKSASAHASPAKHKPAPAPAKPATPDDEDFFVRQGKPRAWKP